MVEQNLTLSHLARIRVAGIITETQDAKTFVLEPLDGWQPVYQPGQFITLVFQTGYGERRRSYSISSAPALNEPLSITVKKMDNGEFSRMLIFKVKEGDILYTSGIGGLFRLPENIKEDKQFFFLAAGSGITPCFSLIKTLLKTARCKIVLIYSNKAESDTIFLEQLKRLQELYASRFTIRFLFSNIFNVYHSRLSHWLLQQELLPKLLSVDKEKAYFYMCGPYAYMQMIGISLLGSSVPAHNILKESFDTMPRKTKPKPPDTRAHKVFINIRNQRHELLVQYPETILATAKAAGLNLPYSCEAGRCSSCVATCVSGKVWMAYNEVLVDEELAKGRVLICQAYPVDGDAEIVY